MNAMEVVDPEEFEDIVEDMPQYAERDITVNEI